MSFPDYNQKVDDHKSLLILVKSINGSSPGCQLSSKIFNKLFEKISNIDELSIEDAQGMGYKRIIKLRFQKNVYQNENNDWGDFQAHRKLLGLIGIGRFTGDTQEMQDLYNQFQNVVDKYASTLYDSRFVLFQTKSSEDLPKSDCQLNGGLQSTPLPPPPPPPPPPLSTSPTPTPPPPPASPLSSDTDNTQAVDNCSDSAITPKEDEIKDPLRSCTPIESGVNSFKLQKSLTQCLMYNNVNNEIDINSSADQLEKDVRDFISSLFWVLESKRLDRSYEKLDKVPLLMAPFETKALIGLDTDSKIFKKKCYGRMRKHIGDLSLLAGLASEALTHYGSATETLRSVNDWLWLASALEGQCVASLSLLYPQASRRKSSLQRNSSLPPGKFRQLQEEGNQSVHKPGKFSRRFLSSSIRSRNAPASDPTVVKALGKCLLNSLDEIYEKYKEACCHYAKSRNVAIIELECSFKAARMLTAHEKFLYASEFIQNAVFICFNQSHDEQIKKLSVISDLYTDIGYHRKAAFYKRFAALKAVSLNIQNPNWQQCYYLLLPALDGYHLSLDPLEYDRRLKARNLGWTGIHMQILQELVTASKRMSAEPLAMRHLSFLLHSLFEHLTPNQRRDFAKQLEVLSSNCGEGAPVPLMLENGSSVPCVNLTKFPLIFSFKVQNLATHTRAFKLKSKHRENMQSSPSSPFIFTPLQLNRPVSRRRLSTVASQAVDFKWTEGETCQVLLEVYNYLPVELSVAHMSLMTDGIPFETYPTSLTLPPESGPFPVQLTGTPRSCGKLDILGYTTHVLGIKNNCKLKDLTHAKKMKFPHMYTVDVVPQLPLLQVSCSVAHARNKLPTLKTSSDALTAVERFSVFAGETLSVPVILANTSVNCELIEIVSVSVESKLSKEVEQSVISWIDDEIQNNLPLAPSSSFSFDVALFGHADFLKTIQKRKTSHQMKSRVSSGTSTPQGQSLSTHGSPSHSAIPSKKHQQNLLGTALSNFLSDLQNGPSIGKSKAPPEVIMSLEEEFPTKEIDVTLNFEYSGGKGLASGYCRRCALCINIQVIPSVLITHWDVLPAEIPDNCYLVFDILNATDQEMELFYAANKSILIEGKETCRIPVPIERCPLHDTATQNGQTTVSKEMLHLRCKEYLVRQVQLKWVISATEQSGVASILGIPWTEKMLDAILMSPVKWNIQVNEQVFKPEQELVHSVGESISFTVSITNASGNPLRSVHLWIQCYQDHQNGHRNYRLDMKRALLGADRLFINQISPKETYNHNCVFVFFYPGSYKVDIQCSGTDCFSTDLKKPSISSQTTYCNIPKLGSQSDGSSLKCATERSEPNVWKYSPSIEISITE